jgi:hypothetical protein
MPEITKKERRIGAAMGLTGFLNVAYRDKQPEME